MCGKKKQPALGLLGLLGLSLFLVRLGFGGGSVRVVSDKTLNSSSQSKGGAEAEKKKRGLDPISSPLVAINVVKHPGWIPNRFFHSTIRRH